jgi:hypothetical protein
VSRTLWAVALVGCGGLERQVVAELPSTETQVLELPPDLAKIDFVSVFTDAAAIVSAVNTQVPWAGHRASLDTRAPGCPDFWTGTFTDGALTFGSETGISWFDDCLTDVGLEYNGWATWESEVAESGDVTTFEGRTSEASRSLEGDAIVKDDVGVRFEFDGTASDSLYQVEAKGYQRLVYSTSMDATVTGADAFSDESLTPDGFRTDLVVSLTQGDVETYSARGNVYLFTPQLQGRFDSVQVDMEMLGVGAGPTDCTLEPLGWIGVRDSEAIWYDVVFLPRFEETITGDDFDNPLSVCDGCGRLYVQGVEQDGIDVCIDFSHLFEDYVLPNPDDYVLPIHSL